MHAEIQRGAREPTLVYGLLETIRTQASDTSTALLLSMVLGRAVTTDELASTEVDQRHAFFSRLEHHFPDMPQSTLTLGSAGLSNLPGQYQWLDTPAFQRSDGATPFHKKAHLHSVDLRGSCLLWEVTCSRTATLPVPALLAYVSKHCLRLQSQSHRARARYLAQPLHSFLTTDWRTRNKYGERSSWKQKKSDCVSQARVF